MGNPDVTLRTLLDQIESKDVYTSIHSNRVLLFTKIVLGKLDLAGTEDVLVAAALHDIGKIELDNETLNCTKRLTPEQIRMLRSHPEIGAKLLTRLPVNPAVRAMVLHHHESFDGSGYPHRLAGDAIPVGARIISVVDSFDAMTSDRVYRRAMSNEDAFTELRRFAGSQFDPDIVELFVSELPRYPMKREDISSAERSLYANLSLL